MGLKRKMCALLRVCFSRNNFTFAHVSICNLSSLQTAAVWPGDRAPVSGSSHFTNLESHTQLQGHLHWNKKLRLAVALPPPPSSGLSDINYSWLTVNQIALWAQFSFWFLVPELLIQNIKIRFPSELRSCIYNDKKFSLTETLSCDSVRQKRNKKPCVLCNTAIRNTYMRLHWAGMKVDNRCRRKTAWWQLGEN